MSLNYVVNIMVGLATIELSINYIDRVINNSDKN